jgi:hypothetical protein
MKTLTVDSTEVRARVGVRSATLLTVQVFRTAEPEMKALRLFGTAVIT